MSLRKGMARIVGLLVAVAALLGLGGAPIGAAASETLVPWRTDVDLAASRGIGTMAATPTCGPDSVGGPYRKVIAKAGYRKVEGTIRLPGSTDAYLANTTDGLFNHFGGTASNGSELDMGLTLQPGKTGWVAFARAYDASTGQTPWKYDPSNLVIPPGTSVFMRLYISPDNQANLYYEYTDSSGTRRSSTFSMTVNGFKQDGTGQYLKRVTAVGQNSSAGTNTKSYSLNNVWSNLYVFNTQTSFQWDPSINYGESAGGPSPCSRPENGSSRDPAPPYVVQATETNAYFNETASVDTRNY